MSKLLAAPGTSACDQPRHPSHRSPAGNSPNQAARYQIMVTFLIAAAGSTAAAIGSLLAAVQAVDTDHRLTLHKIT